MSGVIDDFLPSLSKIGEEIDSLRPQHLSVNDTVREIVRIIFTNSNLYYVYAKTIQDERLVVNSVFCRDQIELESFLRSYPKEGRTIDRNSQAGIDNFVAVNGKPRLATLLEKHNTIFDSAIFSNAFSVISLPLNLSSKVIGVLSMASADIVKEWVSDQKNEAIIQLHTDALELLVSKITQTLNSAENNE